ncbi:MAG: hypothetical protein PHI35_04450 [Victivallaceae bacterium]|nr:hypothetical protein [Victivallaceae bacterium]
MRSVLKTLLYFAVIALIGAGCATSDKPKKAKTIPVFEPLAEYTLSLRLVGGTVQPAGGDGVITFSLKNTGAKTVTIEEWHLIEPENIRVYCQLWRPDMTEPDADSWIELQQKIKEPVTHVKLELDPGNQVFVGRRLPFISKIKVEPGFELRYFVKAELNLKSVSLASPVAAVYVTATEPTPLKPAK